MLLTFITVLLAFVNHLSDTTYFALLMVLGLIYLIPFLLNRLGFTFFSRWLVGALPPICIVIFSITYKVLYPESVRIFNYLDVRFYLIGCLVIPLLVIQSSEKVLLSGTLAVSAILLIMLDPLFNFLHLGYEHLVGSIESDKYFFSANFFSISAYLFILFCLLYEKRLSDKAMQENDILIAFLNKANQDLKEQKEEIGNQNSEITLQSQELLAKQEQLIQANALIQKQKESLLKIQSGLESELVSRNQELTNANDELIRYNNELQQFSYTLSHNLRGPLARLLGLTSLMGKDLAYLTGKQLELVHLVGQSATELDDVIRDLSKIIDIRNDIYRIREKVFIQQEWSIVLRSLSTFIQSDMHIETDFREAPMLYTVRPILNSILYNLVSNAIKYRSASRPLHVSIKTSREGDTVNLEVKDNGMGMNLDQFGRNIFGLYKRFHTHTEGKGLGLYLVKLQIEAIGGSVDVKSELNQGTYFKVSFKEPNEVEGQIVFKSDFGSLFYNARTNCAGIIWHKQVNTEQYKFLFSKCGDIVRMYHTPFWISDYREQGTIPPADQQWMVSTIFPEAVRQGLRRVANVYSETQHNEDYRKRIRDTALKLGVEIEFFTTNKQAEEWIESFLEVQPN